MLLLFTLYNLIVTFTLFVTLELESPLELRSIIELGPSPKTLITLRASFTPTHHILATPIRHAYPPRLPAT